MSLEINNLRIAVVGSNGQLGTDLVGLLRNRTHDLYPVDMRDIDITNSESVHNALHEHHPQAIVNCAAYTNVDECETQPEIAMAVNACGPKNLARFAKQSGAWLFHVSTDYVFPGDRPVPEPYTEEDQTGPASQYGISKLLGEQAVAEETNKHTILRTAWLYGASGHNFLKAILGRALKFPAEPLRVVNDQFGSPTWSHSLAAQIAALLQNPIPGICHATSEGYCSWYEFATMFLKEMKLPNGVVPCTTTDFPRPAPRPTNSILENARLNDTEVNAMKNWEIDLRRFVMLHGDALKIECQPQKPPSRNDRMTDL